MLPIPHYDDCQIPLSLRKAVDEAVDAMLKGISVYVAQDCTGMENLKSINRRANMINRRLPIVTKIQTNLYLKTILCFCRDSIYSINLLYIWLFFLVHKSETNIFI